MTEEFGMTELVLRAAASARIDLFLQILTKNVDICNSERHHVVSRGVT